MAKPVSRRRVLAAGAAAAAAAGLVLPGPAMPDRPDRSDRFDAPDSAGKAESGMMEPTQKPWYRRMLVGIEIGPTGANDHDATYMSRASGKAFVQELVRARAEYGVIFMKDMEFAYYNSGAARKAPNLGDRDLLRECVEAGRKHGIPIVAYCQIQYDDSTWRAHPEWRMKDSAGSDIGGRLCYNSGYLEYIKSVAGEMMSYPIARFHFDMLDFGFGPPYGCWCDVCKEQYQKRFGRAMPAGVTWDEPWDEMLHFRCDSNTRFCHELQTFVKARRTEISVDFNYHGYPPFSWLPGEKPVQHAENGDFVTAEGLPWIFGHYNPSLLSLFMAGARPEGPVQGVTSRGVFDYHDFTVRPTAEMKWEVMTYLAHGAQCTIVDKLYYDGATEPLAYARIGEVFGEARAKRELFGHEPVREVGIYYSCRSRDWYGREDPPRYMSAVWGAHRALVEAHIPVGFVMDEDITAERLAQYPVIWLAGTAILTASEVALLDEYVTGGGNLLVTGVSGLYDRFGKIQESSTLSDLVGSEAVRIEEEHQDNYLRFPRHSVPESRFAMPDVPTDWPMLTQAPIVAYRPVGAAAFGEAITAVRSRDNQWVAHMSPGTVIGPAVLVNRRGRGIIVTAAGAPDVAFAGDYRMPEHRNLMRNLVRHLVPEPAVEVVRAPANVETVLTRDRERNRTIVHLLCWNAPPTASSAAFPNGKRVLPPMMEEPTQYEARVRVRTPVGRVSAASREARIGRSGGEIRLTTSAIHEALLIES